jgi:APA family basic amino acid/polyamine antiporter
MQNELVRKLGWISVVAIIVADMVGTGIFTTSGLVMENISSPKLLIVLWAVAGVIALTGALSYAELSTAMPYAGGEYLYLTRLFHPSLGFLSGWISFIVGFSAPLAAVAIGMSEYLLEAFPALSISDPLFGFSGKLIIKKGIAVFVIVVFTFLHLRGLKSGTKIHNLLTLLKVLLILGLIVLGFSIGSGSFEHLEHSGNTVFNLKELKDAGLSVVWVMFAYTGWNAAAYIGSEVKDPAKNLPKALLTGTGIVVLIYVLLNVVFVYALSPSEMEGVISIGGLAVKALFGEVYGQVFSLIIAIILISTVSSLIIIGPRVYYAMSQNGHFFKFAARVNRKGVPALSIISQGIVAIVIALVGAFDQILTYMGLTLSIFPILAVLGVFKLRKQNLSVYRAPLHPLIPGFFIVTNLLIVVLVFAERPVESLFAVGTIVIGIPLYLFFRNKLKNVR